MAINTDFYQDVNGSDFQSTAILQTFVQSFIFEGYSAPDNFDDDNRLPLKDIYDAAYGFPAGGKVWNVGDAHPVYTDTYATAVNITPQTVNNTTSMRINTTWQTPGQLCAVQYDTYQQNIVKNFDVDGNVTVVQYAGPDGSTINVKVPFVANVELPSILRAIRVIQYEIFDGAEPIEISEAQQPLWNEDQFAGYTPGFLLYMGVKSTTDGTPIYRREYTFLMGSEILRFDHTFAVWVDARGLKPPDIVALTPADVAPSDGTVNKNGSAAYKMLDSTSFASLLGQIKKPFNSGFGS